MAETYGWDARPSPKPIGHGTILTGRGIAYCFRNQTVVAQIAEVEVNRDTGHVWVKRLVCAHDCGLVINPEGLQRTIEGNLLYGLSRALHEEVRFDTEKVTSVDWITHPTLTHADAPARIDVVQLNADPNPNRPDLPHYGAGEAACRRYGCGRGQRDLRRDRRSHPPGAIPGCARAGRAQGRPGVAQQASGLRPRPQDCQRPTFRSGLAFDIAGALCPRPT